MIPEVGSLLNSRVEWTVILNAITKDNNKILVDNINKNVKFNRLERSMEEVVSKFKSVVEAEKRNVGPQKNDPWQKKKIPP